VASKERYKWEVVNVAVYALMQWRWGQGSGSILLATVNPSAHLELV